MNFHHFKSFASLRVLSAFVVMSLLAFPAFPRNTASTTITITARVEAFAEWADPTPVLFETDWPALNKTNQSRTLDKSLTLYTNTDTIISAQPALNNGILTQDNRTLTTAYKLTGDLTNPDHSFKPAGSSQGEFFNNQNTYTIAHQKGIGAYTLNLTIQATTPKDSAPDQGPYTCSLILTANW